ncbi:oligosaccharide flippase family protein [Hydrogenimonas sp.]
MLKTLVTQTGWNILGTVFAFTVGFFVKMYLVNAIGAENFGLYIIATSFQSAVSTIVALAIPSVLLKFLPAYIAQKDFIRANALASKFLLASFVTGLVGALSIIVFHHYIAIYVFGNEELKPYLILAALYIPMTLLSSYITSLYRSVLKIKEIIIYSTVYMVSIRATLTFILFSFVNDVKYFMIIELFAYLVANSLMYYKFKNPDFKIFDREALHIKVIDSTVVSYAKKIYTMSLLGILSGYLMTFIMSITLPAASVGIYAILGTIAGLTNFLLQNINRIFSPIISSLVAQKDFKTLAMIYKDSTFLINIVTIPFILIVMLFSKQILGLYGEEFSHYDFELLILFLGNYATISVGSSGTVMVMGGLEKYSLKIQIFKIVFTFVASIILLPLFGLLGAVIIFALLSFMVNAIEVYLIKKHLHIFPLDGGSFVLFGLFIVLLGSIFILRPSQYEIWQYFIYPPSIYLFFLLVFNKKIRLIIQTIRESK